MSSTPPAAIAMPAAFAEAIRNSETGGLRIVDPATEEEYVLIRATDFERLPWKYGPLTREERIERMRAAGLRAGWDDPAMGIYNDLDPRLES